MRAERDRNIPQELVDEFIEAGLIHTLQPKRWGGYEHDHEVAFDIAVELGKSTCASSAWCLNYLADHACMLALFPEEAQHDVWSRNNAACIATSAAPTGKVAPAAGGYRLDGRWSWCSGLRHSQWIMIGGLVQRPGEDHPDMRLYLVPVSELKQDDTWYCAGLRASGSNTAVLDNVFVPEHRSVSFSVLREGCSPGSKVNTNPMYRAPFIALHSYALLGPVLGVARGGYTEFVQWTRQRYLTYTQLAIAHHVPVQSASPRSPRRSTLQSYWRGAPSPWRGPITPACRLRPARCCVAILLTRYAYCAKRWTIWSRSPAPAD